MGSHMAPWTPFQLRVSWPSIALRPRPLGNPPWATRWRTIADLRPSGYTFHHCPRVSKRGGGVGFLYKDNLQVVINPSRKYTTFESMHGTVSYAHSCVDIVVVYRPPGNHSFSTFLDEFSQFLDETMYRPSPLVITGDLNIHFDNTSSPITLRFNDLISGHGISQLVSSPTHDKGHILDVIMVRNSDNVLYSSPKVFSGISDHSAVSCLLKFVKPSRVMSEFTCRNIKKINRTAFAEDIVSCKLMSSPTDSVDCVVENYNSALSRLLNIHAPVKTRKIRKRTDCPWYNSDIAAAKRKRRRLERKWLSNGKSEIDWKLLCAQKNVVNSLLKKAKRSYYVGLIEDCGEDSKRLFSVANRLLNRKQSSPLPSHTDGSAVAETFIDYFRKKVETISNSLCPDESAQEPLTTASLETLKPTDPDEVQALLRRLPPKSCSLDPVPTPASGEALPSTPSEPPVPGVEGGPGEESHPIVPMECGSSASEGEEPTVKEEVSKVAVRPVAAVASAPAAGTPRDQYTTWQLQPALMGSRALVDSVKRY
ncbi:uncharacterized protein [Diadema antillarum]|uniref:uncharacterized protein n=1 Tax=Diadema antillarum TaxID=105358 RepID=UPI003A896615